MFIFIYERDRDRERFIERNWVTQLLGLASQVQNIQGKQSGRKAGNFQAGGDTAVHRGNVLFFREILVVLLRPFHYLEQAHPDYGGEPPLHKGN